MHVAQVVGVQIRDPTHRNWEDKKRLTSPGLANEDRFTRRSKDVWEARIVRDTKW
ncbi:hypothetical protein BS78_05G289200 [Paspalum vaginatum]|nr:hypothetical protein BS78_05G289200 [Paspalum vaginatum]